MGSKIFDETQEQMILQDFIELTKEGYGKKESYIILANKWFASDQTIANCLRKYSEYKSNKIGRPKAQIKGNIEQIRKEYQEIRETGCSMNKAWEQLAKEHKLSKSTIANYCNGYFKSYQERNKYK
ncbi:MAG: hypothetical protein SFH39_00150 [Candidatus Magnetobacterium sp. LHC-1]